MLIALHYCQKDQALALSLAEWLAEIGPFPHHDFLIFRDHRAANASFGGIDARSVKEIIITDDVANSWPASANHAFKKIAKHVQYACQSVPFLMLEPDAVILRASTFDEIEAEYQAALAAKKVFLGDLIDHRGNKPGANFQVHMSGVGVYPGNMTHYAGEVFYADEKTPWDISAGPAIHSQAKQSELIFHVWNQNGQGLSPFKDWSDVEQKIFARRPKCALFHSDKTGTLLGLLREQKNFSGGVESRHAEVVAGTPVANINTSFPAVDSPKDSGFSARPAQNNLPVPVLAVPLGYRGPIEIWDARESTPSSTNDVKLGSQTEGESRNSCGGQNSYEATVWPQPDCNYQVTAHAEPASQPESSAEPVLLGGTGAHGIECTCLKRDFPCPFHFRDYEHVIDDAKVVYDKLAYQKFAQTLQTPWAIKEWSVSEIKLLAARLCQFQTNVAYVRFVRSLLAEAGVIVLPKKKRRKRKKK